MSDPTRQPVLSVISPIYNEEKILWEMTVELAGHLDTIIGEGLWQFVIVDNGSTDTTPEIVKRIEERWPLTKAIWLDQPDYGNAMKVGLANTDTPYAHIINIEQWDMVFLAWAWSVRDRYDLFLGSKRADPTLNHQSNYRRFLSWGLNAILDLNYQYVGADTHGPKLIKMETMRLIFERCVMRRGQFDTEFVLRALKDGLWISESPTVYLEHRPPRNFMIKKILQNLLDQITLYRQISPLPYVGPVKFHRFARCDQEAVADKTGKGTAASIWDEKGFE